MAYSKKIETELKKIRQEVEKEAEPYKKRIRQLNDRLDAFLEKAKAE